MPAREPLEIDDPQISIRQGRSFRPRSAQFAAGFFSVDPLGTVMAQHALMSPSSSSSSISRRILPEMRGRINP